MKLNHSMVVADVTILTIKRIIWAAVIPAWVAAFLMAVIAEDWFRAWLLAAVGVLAWVVPTEWQP